MSVARAHAVHVSERETCALAEPAVARQAIDMRVDAVRWAARGIRLYKLVPCGSERLPAATPGAHIDLHLANGLIRSYSLVSTREGPDAYVVAIKRDPASRGGSEFVHEFVRVGDILRVGPPRNNFPFDETAPHSVFIAGGIGITPIRAMIERAKLLQRSWQLHYACRSRDEAPFLSEFEGCDNVRLHFDDESDGRFLDLDRIVSATAATAHLYCCGPAPMLQAFSKATAGRPANLVHLEYFSPAQAKATDGSFFVELYRTGRRFQIPPGKTILDVLIENGIDIAYSCREGVCGTCEVSVLSGTPDHRDEVLSEADKAEGKRMMICCSGARDELLVLDV